MMRHGLSMCTETSVAQNMPSECETKCVQFQKCAINARKEKVLNLDRQPLLMIVP